MFKILIVVVAIVFITYRFCKIAYKSDNQKLEDELFIKTYGHEKIIGDCEVSVSNDNTKLGQDGAFDEE